MKKKFAAVLFSGFLMAGMSLPVMAASYPDVGEGDWFFEYVQDVSNLHLMTGYSNGYFGAYDNLTRGQFATILWRMSGSPSVGYDGRYPDVASDIFYAEASKWASENQVITGYSDGRFGGNDNITREQVATILKRYAPKAGKDASAKGKLSSYPDAGSVSEFAREGMEYAVGAELIKGDNNMLNPQGNVNRAVASTLISRFHRAPEHKHTWVEEKGHYKPIIEKQWIVDKEASYEMHMFCKYCGLDLTEAFGGNNTEGSSNHAVEHFISDDYDGSDLGSYSDMVYSEEQGHYEDVVVGTEWVVDKPAWTEVIPAVTQTVCSECGAVK